VLQLLHGAKEPPHAHLLGEGASVLVKSLKGLSWSLRWIAISAMPAEYIQLKADSSVSWPEGSCFAHFWQMAESYALRHVCDFACQKQFMHLTKAFDGIRVDADRVPLEDALADGSEAESFCVACSRYVAAQPLAFVVEFREKIHVTLYALLERTCGFVDVELPQDIADLLEQPSAFASISAAMHHILKDDSEFHKLCGQVRDYIETNQGPAVAQGCLDGVTYADLRTVFRMRELVPFVELPHDACGIWLIHLHDMAARQSLLGSFCTEATRVCASVCQYNRSSCFVSLKSQHVP